MPTSNAPLNGTITHPLTSHAIGKLRDLVSGPKPTAHFNPGVINRLTREDLAELFEAPSPYVTHKGRNTTFLRITDAGRERLRELEK